MNDITDNFAGLPPTSPLIVAMNEASAERAKILRAAIDRLSVPPATPQAQGETVWRSEPPTLDEIEDCPFWWWSGDGDKPIAVEVWPEEVGGRGYVDRSLPLRLRGGRRDGGGQSFGLRALLFRRTI